MVAVGDEDGLGGHQPADGGVRLLIGHDPEPVFDPQVIGRHQRRAIAQTGLDRALDFLGGVGIEAEDGTEIETGRVVEGQAVGLGAGEGLFVGVDLALADRLEANPRQESLARVLFAVDFEGLVVDIERRVVVLAENPLAQPVLEEPGGPRVAVDRAAVARLIAVELQADDVVRAGLVEPVLQGRVDHVVRRRNHVGQGADACDVVTDTAKGMHVRHRLIISMCEIKWS